MQEEKATQHTTIPRSKMSNTNNLNHVKLGRDLLDCWEKGVKISLNKKASLRIIRKYRWATRSRLKKATKTDPKNEIWI